MCFGLWKLLRRKNIKEKREEKKRNKKPLVVKHIPLQWEIEKINSGYFGRTNSESRIVNKKYFNERRNSF